MLFSIWHGATVYFGTVYGLSGPIDSSGLTYNHWFTSCLAFTLLIHIVTFKLFIETVYWNWIMTIVNLGSLLCYYSNVLFGNIPFVSQLLQPQINGEYWNVVKSGKGWVCLIVLPAVALLPDITYLLC